MLAVFDAVTVTDCYHRSSQQNESGSSTSLPPTLFFNAQEFLHESHLLDLICQLKILS